MKGLGKIKGSVLFKQNRFLLKVKAKIMGDSEIQPKGIKL
jgi:hypothetical protein